MSHAHKRGNIPSVTSKKKILSTIVGPWVVDVYHAALDRTGYFVQLEFVALARKKGYVDIEKLNSDALLAVSRSGDITTVILSSKDKLDLLNHIETLN